MFSFDKTKQDQAKFKQELDKREKEIKGGGGLSKIKIRPSQKEGERDER